jgi:hypothetical protein
MRYLLAALFALGTVAHAQTKIVANWTNPNQSLTACSTTATSACTKTQTLTMKLTSSTAPATVVSSTISPTASTYTITPLPSPGAYTLSLTQDFLDFGGLAQTTAAATTTVTVPAPFVVNPPTGFTGVVQ